MSDDVNLTMTDLADVAALVEVAPDSTVSRTVLKAEGARLVLFSFDEGQDQLFEAGWAYRVAGDA